MSFKMSDEAIKSLCHLAYCADKETRSDLAQGYISNENDYTSNFTGALRRIINAHSSLFAATSYVLESSLEQEYGCDATIIIQSNNQSKILLFEAKYPRIKTPAYRWDYPQTATGLSHFSDQLDRQDKCHSHISIFEMFYCEYDFDTQPPYMKDEVSSCVWHETTLDFKNSKTNPNAIWNHNDLENLFLKECLSIKKILKDVCNGVRGQPINIIDYQVLANEFKLTKELLIITVKDNSAYKFPILRKPSIPDDKRKSN